MTWMAAWASWRDLRATFTREITTLRDSGLADLKSSQQETRASANSAGKRAGDAVTAVAELRRDVDQLRSGLEGLRLDVGEVLALLRTATPAPAGGPADRAAGVVEEEHGLLPQQRQLMEEPAPTSFPSGAGAEAGNALDDQEPADNAAPDPREDAPKAGEEPAAAALSEPGRADEHEEQQERAALQAARTAGTEEPAPSEVKEPAALSEAGRIWAIMRAGRVASATLVCHRDTWEFVASLAGSHPHFRAPALEEREAGLVAAVLSGRSLVAVLLALYRSAKPPHGADDSDETLAAYADWAMASEVYQATAEVLAHAAHAEGEPVVVTIDSRLPATRP
ncbi:hypothetical protein [Streptomyces axinellae]|uniref:Uncharacterized protein n=1 Tax=Streptomyces axinellae TaxID=552788 RepID=A0ABP6D8Y2_9ACTN